MSQSMGIPEEVIIERSNRNCIVLWVFCFLFKEANCCLKEVNCSAWNRTPATFNDFNHIFLASAGYWNYPLAELFRRSVDWRS